MKNVFGYVRVSTVRQGDGVSLEVQKDAIERYAEAKGLKIIQWFDEKETAAKQGRPVFSAMMKMLKAKRADGLILHKIDRGARNLKDWLELMTLNENGTKIHLAHENLDLSERGGRLAGDIQFSVASDYIRNLRQESIKGLYGRLQQGIYPWFAPIGYLNNGKGKYKTLDPIQAPLVRRFFELYVTRQYSLLKLVDLMYALGLRNWKGKKVNIMGLSRILRNPFYYGVILIKGQTFYGGHEPLISHSLFKRAQLVLKNNTNQKIMVHDFKFKKMIRCAHCNYALTGETQKGIRYYRCHTKGCQTKSIREALFDHWIGKLAEFTELRPNESEMLMASIKSLEAKEKSIQEEFKTSLKLQRGQSKLKLERITDLFIDEKLEADAYYERKAKILDEIKVAEEQERQVALKSGRL